MRWTITNDCGDVLARFQSGEEAWNALSNNVFLDCVSERYEEETDCCVLEFRICFDGAEVVIH